MWPLYPGRRSCKAPHSRPATRVYVGAENILGPGVGVGGEAAVDDGGQQGDVRLLFVEALVDDYPGREFAVLHLAAPGVVAQVVVRLEHFEAAFGDEIAVIVGHPVLRSRGEVAAGDVVELPVAEVEPAAGRIAFARIGVDEGSLSGGGVEVPGVAVGDDVEDPEIGILVLVFSAA